MQKEDIQWAVLGILILLVVALVVKPMATGQPPNLGLPVNPTPNITVSSSPTPIPTQSPVTIPKTTESTPTPTTTWNKAVQTINFVDPSTYGVSLNESLPNATRLNSGSGDIRNSNMTTYATFSGQYSGTTQTVKIPFPYWELWYTVDPVTSYVKPGSTTTAASVTIRSTLGISVNAPVRSYSSAMPEISIQVVDAFDPNRIVRVITPPGTIDPTLWSADSETLNKAKTQEERAALERTYSDPRPWKEKFYEGRTSYYFIVKTSLLKSYKIDIMVPTSYVGKY